MPRALESLHRALPPLLPLVLLGCAVEASGPTDDFCAHALARVDSFLVRARAAEPVRKPPKRGGTVVVAGNGEMAGGMNSLTSADHAAAQHQAFVNLTTLVRYDESFAPVPWLASSWEVDDEASPTRLTFRLRGDVLWHDGERTDAHDVAFTYLRATDPRTGYPNPAHWQHYVGGEEGVEVLDSLTVSFRLRPHADYMDPWRSLAILPQHLLGDVPPAELALHPYGTECPVGNGPFVFQEHRPLERWTFVANPSFPEGLGGRPWVDRYVFRVIPESTTLLAEYLTGRVDVYVGVPSDQAERIAGAADSELRPFAFRSSVFIAWNGRRGPLADRRVRRALTQAVDRREILDGLRLGYGSIAVTGVPPFHWAHDPGVADSLPHDPNEARRLLESAGWRDRDGDGTREDAAGTPLRLTLLVNQSREREGIAEVVRERLARVGVDLRIRVLEYQTLLHRVTDAEARDFDALLLSFVEDFRVDHTDLFHSARADGPYAWSGTRSAAIDRLLDTLPLVVDREEARPLWHEYQNALVAEAPFTWLFFPERIAGVSRRVRGVEMDMRGEWITVQKWWIATGSSHPPGS